MADPHDLPERAPASHLPCRRCRAWTEAGARRCDLCGAGVPGRWLPPWIDRGLRARHVGMAVGGAAGAAAAVSAAAAIVAGTALPSLVAAAVIWGAGAIGAVSGLSVGAMWGGWCDDGWLHPPGPRPLAAVEEHLQRRAARLALALVHIDASRKRLQARLAGDALRRGLAALDAAERATRRQLERYELDLLRATLVRLHNRLAPADRCWRRADRDQCEELLRDVGVVAADVARAQTALAAAAGAGGPAGQRLARRLDDLAGHCEALRDALLLRQAAALAEAAPGIAAAFDVRALVPEVGERGLLVDAERELHALLEILPLLDDESRRLEAELAAIDEVAALDGGG